MAQQKASAAKKVSVKHIQIDKSQSKMLALVALTVVVAVFGLFGTKALITKGLYQRRALHAQRDVIAQLKSNYDSAQTLFTQYKEFAAEDPNVLQGSISGNGNLDGDNPKIVLDSLPSTYDAPALATSLEKILNSQAVTINSISVVDDPGTNSDQPQAKPQPKAVTFSVSGTTTFDNAQKLLQKFEHSIRPFDLNTLQIGGTDNAMQVDMNMVTYYQPAKSLNLTPTKEVK